MMMDPEMISIRRSEVPLYLRPSLFYQSLSEEDDEEISVLRNNLKQEATVNRTADLKHMLSTSRFWGLDILPETALEYATQIADADAFNQIEEFEDPQGTVKSLKAVRFADREDKMQVAAKNGRIDFLRHMLSKGTPVLYITGVQAATHNQFACLEFITWHLEENATKPYKNVKLVEYISDMGFECWKHLYDHGASLAGCTATKAAEAGNLQCLRFVHETKAKVNSQCLTAAIENGHLDCVRFIHEVGNVAITAEHAAVAAGRGDLVCLTYLLEHGCPTNYFVTTAAAKSNSLECLKYAHEQGVPWDETTCTAAAYGGYLPSLVYAHTHGCPWDHHTYEKADFYVSCMAYLQQNGCPRTAEETAALRAQQAASAAGTAASAVGSTAASTTPVTIIHTGPAADVAVGVAVADGTAGVLHTESASEAEDESLAPPFKRQKQVHEVGATTGSSTSGAEETVGPTTAVGTLAHSHITSQEVEEEPGEVEA